MCMNLEELRFPIGKYIPGEITIPVIESWIDDISALPSELNKALDGTDDASLEYVYRPDGWSIRQLVHHLADSHMNSLIRFKLALTEDNPMVKPYLENVWAKMDDVYDVPISASMQILEGVHARLTALLRGMSVTDFSKRYTHPEHGKSMDLAFTTGMYSWHGRHHIEHIKLALKSQKTTWS